MSDILIKGVEMPKNCFECPWRCKVDPENLLCRISGEYFEETFSGAIQNRHKSCPLVEIPPHGDLIDRDALRASIGESIEKCHKWADEVDKDTMMYARISQSLGTFVECSLRAKAAPTIIPAEEVKE